MIKSGFRYLRFTAVVAGLAITLIGLSGLLSMTSMAQENRTLPPREIDLRAKLKDKKFPDGRRVVIEPLPAGEKIVAEVKDAKFINWFLVAADGTEVQGVVKKKTSTATTSSTCTATIVTTTTTTNWRGVSKTTASATIVQIPCPSLPADDTIKVR